MDGVSAASLSSAVANAYDMAVMKKSMDSMESQAESLINDMLAAVPLPAPSLYGFDVYA